MSDPYRTELGLIEEISTFRIQEKEQPDTGHSQNVTGQKETQTVLWETQERFRAFMDNSPVVAWAKDDQGRYIYINQTCADRFRVRMDDWYGKTDFELWPDLALLFQKSDRMVLASNQPIEIEEEIITPDGGRCRWWIFKFTFQNAAGQRYVGGVSLDITERRRMEEALRESEKKFRHIFENAVEGIYQTTPDGRFIQANPALARLLGYESPEELISTITDVGTQVYAYPEDREKTLSLLKKHGFTDYLEIPCRHKDGHHLWSLHSCRLVRDDQGKILYIEGIAQDITRRKETEEELNKYRNQLERLVEERTEKLKASENKYRTLFENGNVAIFLMKHYVYVDCNAKALELFGCTRERLVNKTFDDLFPQFQSDGSRSRRRAIEIYDAAASGIPQHTEWQYLRGDGTIGDVDMDVDAVEAGGERLVQVVVRDISKRKRAERALKQKEAELLKKARALEESNIALKVLLEQKTKHERELEQRFVVNVQKLVLPYLNKIDKSNLDSEQRSCISIIESNLNEVVSPLLHTIQQLNLTPMESRVASLIRAGRSTKEIADILGVATSSIHTYRNKIRHKLGLNSKKVNLQSALQSLT